MTDTEVERDLQIRPTDTEADRQICRLQTDLEAERDLQITDRLRSKRRFTDYRQTQKQTEIYRFIHSFIHSYIHIEHYRQTYIDANRYLQVCKQSDNKKRLICCQFWGRP